MEASEVRWKLAAASGLTAVMFILLACLPADGAPPPGDPCTLVTQDQASAALGMKAAPGKHPVARLCEWDVPGQPFGIRGKKATVGLLDAKAWNYMKLQMPRGHVTKTTVSGLGDDAVFTSGEGLGTLSVKKGDIILDIHVYGFPVNELKDKEIMLAKAALAKL
jgi:hypothetical protein